MYDTQYIQSCSILYFLWLPHCAPFIDHYKRLKYYFCVGPPHTTHGMVNSRESKREIATFFIKSLIVEIMVGVVVVVVVVVVKGYA